MRFVSLTTCSPAQERSLPGTGTGRIRTRRQIVEQECRSDYHGDGRCRPSDTGTSCGMHRPSLAVCIAPWLVASETVMQPAIRMTGTHAPYFSPLDSGRRSDRFLLPLFVSQGPEFQCAQTGWLSVVALASATDCLYSVVGTDAA